MNTRSTGRHSPLNDRSDSSPIRISPFDFGNSREEIFRSLDLNRQLLHDANVVLKLDDGVDNAAVRRKIDDLLDRLLDRNLVEGPIARKS